jgi:anti-sigma factor RsiW
MAPVQPPHDPSTLSEADVQAFADGLLPPERAAEVERYLRGRPDEARRVAFYGRLNGMMQSSFEHGHDAGLVGVPPRLRWRAALMVALHRWLRPVLAVLAVVLIAAGAAVLAVRVPPRSIDDAALAALTNVVQRGAQPDSATGAQAAVAATTAPDLSHAGMHVQSAFQVRVGLLRHADGFVYRNGYDQPMVLLRVDDPTSRPNPQWRALRAGDDRLLMWTTGHTRYVLAGRANTHGLMQAADLLTLGSSLMSRPPHADAASGSRP